jgi:hypothetical protein
MFALVDGCIIQFELLLTLYLTILLPGWAQLRMVLSRCCNLCGLHLKLRGEINALQQQNALLNQQLSSQSMSHIHHLQQLLPHQSINPPQPQASSPQVPVQPEPPTPKVQPEVPPSTSQPFNTDEMVQLLLSNVQEDLEVALKKFKDSQPPQ